MAITINIPNNRPFVNAFGMATKLAVISIPEPPVVPVNEVNYCNFESPFSQVVFGSNTNDWWKNDLSRFTFKRFVSADSVVIKLYKNNVSIATLNNNTYGTFTNGFSGTSEQQLYVSMLVDWKLVYLAFGHGNYQIKADLTILGVVSEFESIPFLLLQYTDIRANKTVRIETQMDGKINGSIFDYTGLDLYHSYRILGDFIENVEELEVNKYKTSLKEWKQIQDKVIENYELRTKMLPRVITSEITKIVSLSNSIKITDYKILAEEIYRRIEVYPVDFEKTQLENNRKSIYNIKFTAKKELNIKRNF